jgi:hypothetical protein
MRMLHPPTPPALLPQLLLCLPPPPPALRRVPTPLWSIHSGLFCLCRIRFMGLSISKVARHSVHARGPLERKTLRKRYRRVAMARAILMLQVRTTLVFLPRLTCINLSKVAQPTPSRIVSDVRAARGEVGVQMACRVSAAAMATSSPTRTPAKCKCKGNCKGKDSGKAAAR